MVGTCLEHEIMRTRQNMLEHELEQVWNMTRTCKNMHGTWQHSESESGWTWLNMLEHVCGTLQEHHDVMNMLEHALNMIRWWSHQTWQNIMMPEYDLGTCQEHVLGMTFLNMTKLVRTWQWNRSGTCHAWNMTAWIRFSIKLRPFHGGSIDIPQSRSPAPSPMSHLPPG